MKRMILLGCMCTTLLCCCSCRKELIEYRTGDLRIGIEPGSEWLHDFPLVLGIKKKNAPQVAVWLEDTAGNYLSTVYATHKIATCSWKFAGGNRRKEALPHGCHATGIGIRRLAVGADTGMAVYEKVLVSVFGEVRFLLLRPRRFTPYRACGAGTPA